MKLRNIFLLLAFMGMILFFSCEKQDGLIPDETIQVDNQLNYVPNQVIIKFKEGTNTLKSTASVISLIQGEVDEVISTGAMKMETTLKSLKNNEIVVVNSKLSTMEAIEILRTRPEVEYAEPNWIYTHFATSNDPYYTNGSLWGMYGDATTPANQYGSQAGEAWAAGKTGSNTVWIGIIDEGYMYTHEDLAANAGTNPGEIAGNGVDDDGNGYVDDVYGWDFAGNNNTVFDGVEDDHGTHVAGTIGAVGGNAKGVAGVVWSVKLMSGKFLGKTGGTTTNAIKAVDYFTDLKLRHGINLVATNNSWGGGGYSLALEEAIERANNAGILFIAAAGNETADATTLYPVAYPNSNLIGVASITNTGTLSSFSNYSSTTVDLGAPGSSIYSTIPKKSGRSVIAGYASYSGTSMATPHVTGAAALYASTHAGATASQIKSGILGSVVPTASLSGKCVTGGRLNVSGF
jgi:subtilisin family serine protease